MKVPTLLVVLIGAAVLATAGRADDLDDILGGFEEEDEAFAVDDDAAGSDEAVDEDDPGWEQYWDLRGEFRLDTSYNYIQHESGSGTYFGNMQKLRSKLSLILDIELPREWTIRASGYGFYDFAPLIHGRDKYTSEYLDIYEYDVQLTDTYIEGSLHEKLDLKVGRQVVNWGRSETLRVLDVINPLDNREPGIVDLKDIKLAVGMVRLGAFWGPWTLTALVIPEIRNDINPVYGSDFYPTLPAPNLGAPGPFQLRNLTIGIDEETPSDFSKAVEGGVNITGIFSGWDISIQAARYHEDTGRVTDLRLVDAQLVPPPPPPPPTFVDATIVATATHSSLWMVGAGGNYTWGSFLFKAELAYIDGLEYAWVNPNNTGQDFLQGNNLLLTDKTGRIDAMVGVEYYGFTNITIALEVGNRHILDYRDEFGDFPNYVEENRLETALRVSWSLFNERLDLMALVTGYGATFEVGSFARLSADYEIMDALNLEGGIVFYQEGDDPFFQDIGDNDRLFMGIRYSF